MRFHQMRSCGDRDWLSLRTALGSIMRSITHCRHIALVVAKDLRIKRIGHTVLPSLSDGIRVPEHPCLYRSHHRNIGLWDAFVPVPSGARFSHATLLFLIIRYTVPPVYEPVL